MSRTTTTESAHGRSQTPDGLPPGMSRTPEAAPVAWEDYEDAHLFFEPAELTLHNFDYMAVLCEVIINSFRVVILFYLFIFYFYFFQAPQ